MSLDTTWGIIPLRTRALHRFHPVVTNLIARIEDWIGDADLKLFLTFLLVLFLGPNLLSPESDHRDDRNDPQSFPQVSPLQPVNIRELNTLLTGIQLPETVTSGIEQVLRQFGFNGTVALARHGEVLYRGSFGVTDFISKRPMAVDDQFQLASVSKQFTAMSIMMLAERGLLNYDDLFTQYIPEFPYADVTIRHLLNHTGGMPNYMSLMERCWTSETLPDNEDMLNALIKYKPALYFTPGRRFDYSNTGYALLALLVKRLSQRPFAQFLEEEIFVPLGMWDTFVYSASGQNKGERQLSGHHRYRRRWEPTPETLHEEVLGDKGIFSTVEDLLKWDRALHQGTLIPAARLAEAYEPLILKNGRHWKYGFGFRIEDNPLRKVVFHYGRWNSFSTCIVRELDSEYTVIMLSNLKRSLDPLQKRIRALLPPVETEPPSMEMVLDHLKSALLSTLTR